MHGTFFLLHVFANPILQAGACQACWPELCALMGLIFRGVLVMVNGPQSVLCRRLLIFAAFDSDRHWAQHWTRELESQKLEQAGLPQRFTESSFSRNDVDGVEGCRWCCCNDCFHACVFGRMSFLP